MIILEERRSKDHWTDNNIRVVFITDRPTCGDVNKFKIQRDSDVTRCLCSGNDLPMSKIILQRKYVGIDPVHMDTHALRHTEAGVHTIGPREKWLDCMISNVSGSDKSLFLSMNMAQMPWKRIR